MKINELLSRAFNFEWLSADEGAFLFEKAPLTELMYVADELRKKQVPHGNLQSIPINFQFIQKLVSPRGGGAFLCEKLITKQKKLR